MRSNKTQELAHRVCHYYKNVCDRDRKLTYRHFTSEGIPKSTIFSILKRFEISGSRNYKKLTGRPAKVMSSKVVKKIEKIYNNDPGVSVGNVAKKMRLPKTTIQRIKAEKLGLRTYKASTIPTYTEDQKKEPKKIVEKLVKKG